MIESEVEEEFKFCPPLYLQRYKMTRDIIESYCESVTHIADFGCAEGRILRFLKSLTHVKRISCVDIDNYCLEQCLYEARPLNWEMIFGRKQELDIDIYCGSVADNDERLKGVDAITCVELIEHLKYDVLTQMTTNIFGYIKPKLVIITTPNCEFNVVFNLKTKFRHWDHKFEWNRQQFQVWCQEIVDKYPEYSFKVCGVGDPPNKLEHIGYCTQIAIFERDLNYVKSSKQESKSSTNYILIESFHYEKSEQNIDNNNEDSFIDWDSVLRTDASCNAGNA